MNRHEQTAREYWTLYRPQALAAMDQEEAEEFFRRLGVEVMEEIGQTAEDLLAQVPMDQRAGLRRAVRHQATEIVYAERIYLPKEPGTEHHEM